MIGIYKITSPSGKIYIGQSSDIEKRFKKHKTNPEKNLVKLYISFKNYGVEKHIFEIIEECLTNELNNRERYYQEIYDVIGENGLNLRLTNTLYKKGQMSNETKIKMSNWQFGKIQSQITKNKISKAAKGSNYRGIMILNTETGIFYFSISEASISINMDNSRLTKCLKGIFKNKTNLIYA